jgi:GNAT superfamily N-acetyltransferase
VTREEVSIGLARPEEVPALADVERAAGALFAGWAVALEADPAPADPAELEEAQRAGRLWVARSDSGRVVGFALVDVVDGRPHLEEMDVHPDFGRRGIGARLVAAVCDWARGAGHSAITLTTFRDIPWNAPFYRRHGFRELAPRELTPALRAIVADEAARGLDPATRVIMSLEVTGTE